MTGLLDGLDQLIGARETEIDMVTPSSVGRLAATLDVDNPAPNENDLLPPGWHCSYFVGGTRPEGLAVDGLPTDTGLLPEIALPRRMFGGARLEFLDPLRIGDAITRTSELIELEEKESSLGPLVRAVLRWTISNPRGPSIIENQDILYLSAADPNASPPLARPAPTDPTWQLTATPDPVLLFRYSAITFNAHRIHYDTPYTVQTEGYPGLLVQGTLLALLLLELCREFQPDTPVHKFSYRAVRPVYDVGLFVIAGSIKDGGGENGDLWIADSDGALAMKANVEFQKPSF